MKIRPRDGFTLLELLIALSLVGMIVAALMGGLRIGTRAWESGQTSASLDEAEFAARAIAEQFERTFPASLRGDAGAPTIAFDGGPKSCRFVALSEGDAQWGGLVTTEIGGDDSPRGQVLAAWTRVFRESDFGEPRDAMRRTVLLENLAYLKLSYFGATAPAQPELWRDNWRNASLPPRLVAVRVGMRGPRGVIETSATAALLQR